MLKKVSEAQALSYVFPYMNFIDKIGARAAPP